MEHTLFQCDKARWVWRLAGAIGDQGHSNTLTDTFLAQLRSDFSRLPSTSSAILGAYNAYHIWLARNVWIFEGNSHSPRLILERIRTQAKKGIGSHANRKPSTAWDISLASATTKMIFISWKPPSQSFFKVNFDSSILDGGRHGGAVFVSRGPNSRFIAVGGSSMLDISVPKIELTIAWEGIRYAQQVLRIESILLKGDLTIMVGWIQSQARETFLPLTVRCLGVDQQRHCLRCQACLPREEQSGKLGCLFIAEHSIEALWTDWTPSPGMLRGILFSSFFGCTHTRLVL